MANSESNNITFYLLEKINLTLIEIEKFEELIRFLNLPSNNLIEELKSFLKDVNEEINDIKPDEKYLNQFSSLITQIFNAIPYKGQQNQILNNIKNSQNNMSGYGQNFIDNYKGQVKTSLLNLTNLYNNFKFLFDFFKNLAFFQKI